MAALVVLTASPASAVDQPYERNDAANEVPYRAGDIAKIRIGYTDELRLSVYARANRSATSPEWTAAGGRTNIVWKLRDDPGATVDWTIRLYSRIAGPTVQIRDEAGTVVNECDVHVVFANAGRYTIEITPDCLGTPSSVRAKATFTFKPPGQPPRSIDNSPGNTFTPAVERAI